MIFFVLFCLMLVGDIAIAQEVIATIPAEVVQALPWWADLQKLLAVAAGFYVSARGVSEGLTRISVWTDNKWDNKLAEGLASATWIMGSAIGKFGYGTPKPIIAEAAKQMAEKANGK